MGSAKKSPLKDDEETYERARERWLPVFEELIDEQRGAFEAGDSMALFTAIHLCMQIDMPIPMWISNAYHDAYMQLYSYKARTLDEAFRFRRKKGYYSAQRKRFKLRFWVYLKVNELRGEGVGLVVAFRRVAVKVGIGVTLAKTYYYEARAILEDGFPKFGSALRKK